ncbi:MAG: CehA/McbA family metallohydrolase, partial [Candidatus Neomarinimicrobiota bacterium]
LDRPEVEGYVKWWVTFHYRLRGRGKHCTSHNLPGLPGGPLHTYLATDPLPGPGVVWGDLHHHTSLTEDMIEFGAPLEATQAAATAMGLRFVALTDHSYDLDDQPGSWRRTDPALAKWHASRQRIAELNSGTDSALLLPGEEVSVRNGRGRNVHALALGHPDFLPGTGDGGEGSLRRRSELDLPTLARRVLAPGLVIAAHPCQPVRWLQRFIVRRDTWSDRDTAHDGITGLQILNGRLDKGFERGLQAWKRLLLEGRRAFIYAGSDSHGDFNRFRVIGLPFVHLTERDGSTLGGCRTGLLGSAPKDQTGIMAALHEGRCLISNGPFIDLAVKNGETTTGPGGSLPGGDLEVRLRLSSTPEFGPLTRLRLYQGIIGARREHLLIDRILGTGRYDYQWRHRLNVTEPAYLRAEAQSRLPAGNVFGNSRGLAFTNPVWVEGAD